MDFTAPADPIEAAQAKAALSPTLRVPKPMVTKATTIVEEGAGGATSWTANEQKMATARLIVLLDTLLDADLVGVLNEALAARAARASGGGA